MYSFAKNFCGPYIFKKKGKKNVKKEKKINGGRLILQR
jgi:hypothetical protein